MEDRITITLKEYLDGGYSLPENIHKFITLDVDENEYNINDMFIQRNLYKEIGNETQELFKHNLTTLIDEALVMYNPQLKLLNENYNNLTNRKTTETTQGEATRNNNNKNYLNPANTSSEKLSDRNETETHNVYGETKEKSYAWLDNNAKILESAMKIRTVVLEILEHLDRAFIGEY